MSTLRLLVKPTIFTVGVCGTCFCVASIAQHENNKSRFPFGAAAPRKRPAASVFQDWTQQQQRLNLANSFGDLRRKINAWKNGLTTGQKIACGTIFINFVVFCGWRSRALIPVMNQFFLSQTSKTSIPLSPMILSCFSHSSALHFGVNMYALYSFSTIANALLGPEQLIGLFIGAGTVSSLASIAHRLITGRVVPSLGASGALLGVIAYVCVTRPDSGLLLFFIPLAAGTAIKGLMLVDTVGLLARWSFIDHAAHLGGSLFGVWYATYGERLFYDNRRKVVEQWIKLRSKLD